MALTATEVTDQPSPLRRLQFRLRTLFVVVTLIAAASWVIVDRQRLISERDEAREAQRRADSYRDEVIVKLKNSEVRASRYRAALMEATDGRDPLLTPTGSVKSVQAGSATKP